MREKIMPPLVLTLICVIISGLLVLANAATKDKIAQAQQDKLNTSLEALFGEGQYTPLEDLHYDGVTQVIRSAKNEVIFEITVDGYSTDGLQLLIGIDPEGKLAGISFVSIGETPGLGTKVQDDSFLRQFMGISSSDFTMTPVTGATYSSNGMKHAVTIVGLLGMCPTLAVTTQAVNGLGMGLATTFVLVGSNLVISLLRNVIPKSVKLPCYIVIIAGFVTLIDFLMHGFVPDLHSALGTFLSLITVNCIILGRAEMFACKNKVLPSVLDGLGMGLGFTCSLFTMGSLREILGTGSWLGFQIPVDVQPMSIFIMPAGGFFVLGCVIAVVSKLTKKKPPQKIGCAGCPNAASCSAKGGCEE